MIPLYDWDELYEMAEGAPFGSVELTSKDNARAFLESEIQKYSDIDINSCENVEEAIDKFLEESDEYYAFDIDGNFITTVAKKHYGNT